MTGPTASPAPQVSRRAWTVLGITALTNFVAGLDLSVASVAIPDIQREFSTASEADISWVLTFYMLAYAGFLIPAGRMADRYGRLKALNVGLICFVVGDALAVVAPTLPLLVAARGVQGLGVAAMAPASLGLAVAAWPAERRGTAVAIWGSTLALSSAVGPVVGGALIQYGSWRWAFALGLPMGITALVWGRKVLSESELDDTARTPDRLGALLIGVGTAGLALAIVQGREWGWTSPGILGLIAATVISIAVVVRRTSTHPNPIVPPHLMVVRSFSVAVVATFIFGLGFFPTLYMLVQFFSKIAGYSTLRTGFAISALPIMATIASNVTGRLADRFGYRTVIVPGILSFTVGAIWLRLNAGEDPNYVIDVLPGLMLIGIGIGAGPAILAAAAVSEMEPKYFSLAGAATQTARQLASVIGVAIVVAILGSAETVTIDSFRWAFVYLIGVSATASLVSTLLPGRRAH